MPGKPGVSLMCGVLCYIAALVASTRDNWPTQLQVYGQKMARVEFKCDNMPVMFALWRSVCARKGALRCETKPNPTDSVSNTRKSPTRLVSGWKGPLLPFLCASPSTPHCASTSALARCRSTAILPDVDTPFAESSR